MTTSDLHTLLGRSDRESTTTAHCLALASSLLAVAFAVLGATHVLALREAADAGLGAVLLSTAAGLGVGVALWLSYAGQTRRAAGFRHLV